MLKAQLFPSRQHQVTEKGVMNLTVSLNEMSQTQKWLGLYAAVESIGAWLQRHRKPKGHHSGEERKLNSR